MFFCLHLFGRNDALDYTLFVNNKSSTKSTHIFASVHTLLSPYAKLLHQFFVGICD